ncbi:hypothetical protein Trco_008322 [Trichoderma cornu-damae]|uniref:Uncharacterized protein n=1 Tax=Trichoderma cornu-damae TaxID=654480 RepID=A0A9P8TT14_9HYPO|nr:hypothetical protein Trco_008322 [Trichoderma cornu-damae]
MVRLVHLAQKPVENGQRNRVEVIHAVPAGRPQPQLRGQIEQNVGQLVDHQVSVLQHRARKHRRVCPVPHVFRRHVRQHRGESLFALCRVRVGDARFLEKQSYDLAAARDARPVESAPSDAKLTESRALATNFAL